MLPPEKTKESLTDPAMKLDGRVRRGGWLGGVRVGDMPVVVNGGSIFKVPTQPSQWDGGTQHAESSSELVSNLPNYILSTRESDLS